MLAVAERNQDVMTFWLVVAGIGVLVVVLAVIFAVRGWGKDVKPTLSVSGVGEIKSAPLSVVIAAVGVAFCVAAGIGYKSELAKAEPSRCDEVDVGEVDELHEDRQPGTGTACVNGDEVATFFDGQLRVTLRGIARRRIPAAVLETTGENTPIHTSCPFQWTDGLATGETATLRYIPPPEDAATKEFHEWTLHVERVRGDSADVFVTHSSGTYAGQALRELMRTGDRGRLQVECLSTAQGQLNSS